MRQSLRIADIGLFVLRLCGIEEFAFVWLQKLRNFKWLQNHVYLLPLKNGSLIAVFVNVRCYSLCPKNVHNVSIKLKFMESRSGQSLFINRVT